MRPSVGTTVLWMHHRARGRAIHLLPHLLLLLLPRLICCCQSSVLAALVSKAQPNVATKHTHLSLSKERDGLPQGPQHCAHFASICGHNSTVDAPSSSRPRNPSAATSAAAAVATAYLLLPVLCACCSCKQRTSQPNVATKTDTPLDSPRSVMGSPRARSVHQLPHLLLLSL
jgi:hypothetical protein